MPIMPESDKKEIIKRASFLKRKGYHIGKPDDYSVDFFNEKKSTRISMFYERYDEHCDVSIRFLDTKDSFYMGWFAFCEKDKKIDVFERKVDRILYLVDFMKKSFNKITSLEYCKSIQAEIDELFEKNHPELNIVNGLVLGCKDK